MGRAGGRCIGTRTERPGLSFHSLGGASEGLPCVSCRFREHLSASDPRSTAEFARGGTLVTATYSVKDYGRFPRVCQSTRPGFRCPWNAALGAAENGLVAVRHRWLRVSWLLGEFFGQTSVAWVLLIGGAPAPPCPPPNICVSGRHHEFFGQTPSHPAVGDEELGFLGPGKDAFDEKRTRDDHVGAAFIEAAKLFSIGQ
jgi:hypothetical protein